MTTLARRLIYFLAFLVLILIDTRIGNASPQLGYDDSQNRAAYSFPIVIQGQVVAIVVLQNGRFNCPEGSQRAILVAIDNRAYTGCWTKHGEDVDIKWEDGDSGHTKVKEA